MEPMILQASERTIRGRKTFAMRGAGEVPGVVYGSDISPTSIAVPSGDFLRTLKQAGESTLVDLVVGGASALKVLIQEVQRDPLSGEVTHVDFRQVNMNKPIEAKIKLRFTGEAPAVRELGGTFVKALEEVEVRCLPGKLVHEIDVDLSVLKTFEDALRVKNIGLPEGMELLTEAEVTVAFVEAPRSEAELAALDEAVVEDLTAVEVEKKGKEEAVEGAEPSAAEAPEGKVEPEKKQ